jgi:hypothetical protein
MSTSSTVLRNGKAKTAQQGPVRLTRDTHLKVPVRSCATAKLGQDQQAALQCFTRQQQSLCTATFLPVLARAFHVALASGD